MTGWLLMNDDPGFYITSDTPLAAFLISKGYRIAEIDYAKPRFDFIFTITDHIHQSAQEYNLGIASVNPKTYQSVFRKLTRIVKSQLQWWEDDVNR